MRVCNRCYRAFPEDNTTVLIPENNDSDEEIESVNSSDDDSIVEVHNEFNSIDSDDDVLSGEEDNVENFISNHVVFSNQDPTLNQTEDNILDLQGFLQHTPDIYQQIYYKIKHGLQ